MIIVTHVENNAEKKNISKKLEEELNKIDISQKVKEDTFTIIRHLHRL